MLNETLCCVGEDGAVDSWDASGVCEVADSFAGKAVGLAPGIGGRAPGNDIEPVLSMGPHLAAIWATVRRPRSVRFGCTDRQPAGQTAAVQLYIVHVYTYRGTYAYNYNCIHTCSAGNNRIRLNTLSLPVDPISFSVK